MRAVITTTVTVPKNLAAWRNQLHDEDMIIVAGDTKTPHDEVTTALDELPGPNFYLHPETQMRWKSSEPIGWCSIQRRNFALLEALSYGADIITTVDTDNYPAQGAWFGYVDMVLERTVGRVLSVPGGPGWYDPGILCTPPVHHRGMPVSRLHPMMKSSVRQVDEMNIGVVASLWLGDPDISAAERIAVDPYVSAIVADMTLDIDTWAPFNSQATTYRREVAPLMAVWPHVGRYDDIWASYLARAAFYHTGHRVHYGRPLVRQERHPHDLVRDLEGEILGMRYTERLVDELLQATDEYTEDGDVIDLGRFLTQRLRRFGWLPINLHRFFDAWFEDVREAMKA